MRRSAFATIAVAAALGAAGVTHAQTPEALVGRWKVLWQGEKRPQESRLELDANGGGRWKTAIRSEQDPCYGLEVPVQYVGTENGESTFRLKFSTVLADCKDGTIRLRAADGGTVTSTRGKGVLSLTKE